MVKMTDIAAHLGLSRLTVSAVLNNRHEEVGISAETAARVRAAAEELGYFPNQLAIATKTGRSQVLGALISGMGQQWVGRVLRGLLRGARESGYLLKIEEIRGPEQEQAALRRFMEQRVAGLFCCNLHPKEEFIRILAETSLRYECPVVATNCSLELAAHRIDSDDTGGYALAVEHLWSLGHRRIGYVGLASGTTTAQSRMRDFVEALQDLGGRAEEDLVFDFQGDPKEEGEARVAAMLSRRAGKPTAVVCGSDYEASHVLRVARRLGVRVPEDLSVMGFSDEGIGQFLDPRLTTVAQPFEQLGYRCAEVLLNQCRAPKKRQAERSSKELLPTRMVVRGSTGPSAR